MNETKNPNNSPQNAEPIPKNCTPDAQNKKVSNAASRSATSWKAMAILWLMVPKSAIPASTIINNLGNDINKLVSVAANKPIKK